MSIFNKTTGIGFQKYGEIFMETTFKNKLDGGRFYLNIKHKKTNKFYKCNEDVYFTVREGIAAIAVTHDLNKNPEVFVIHRICKINAGLYFTFLTVSESSIIEISKKDINDNIYIANKEVFISSLKSSLHVKEILGDYFVVRGSNYFFPGEILNYWELTYIDSGNLITKIDKEEFILNAQEIIFYAPGQEHNQQTKVPCSYLTIIFDMDINKEDAEKLKNTIFKVKQEDIDILTKFNKASKQYDLFTPILLNSLVQMLIVLIISRLNETTSNKPIITKMQQNYDNELLSEIVLYIKENIYSQINVEDICQRFSISRSTIQTLFISNLKISPKQYILDLKFAKAQQMIKESSYSMSEIARICGFSSIHYFSRIFKEKFKTTPTAYAKSIG